MFRLHKGDQIQVLKGKDRGKRGKIERIFTKEKKVLINGLNIIKKHVKPRGEGKPGGIIEMTKPLGIAKVALVCPKCSRVTRIGFQLGKDKQKQRFCRKCGQVLAK